MQETGRTAVRPYGRSLASYTEPYHTMKTEPLRDNAGQGWSAMKKVVVTAISGIDTRGYFETVRQVARAQGQRVEVFDLGRRMLEIAQQRGHPLDEQRVLNRQGATLSAIRSAAFEEFQRWEVEQQNAGADAIVLDLHGVFPWKNTWIPGVDPWYLSRFNPDLYVTLLDDIITLFTQLRQREVWRRLSLEQMLVWRDIESLVTELMAGMATANGSAAHVPHYVLARENTEATFLKLALSSARKAYVSFPIAHIGQDEIDAAHAFAARLGEHFTVFNPMSIDEMDLVRDLQYLLDTGEVYPEPPEQLRFLEAESRSSRQRAKKVRNFILEVQTSLRAGDVREAHLEEIIEHIRDQTVARDYQFVAQSDMVIVRYPPITLDLAVVDRATLQPLAEDSYTVIDRANSRPVSEEIVGMSAGVLSEMIYGHTNDKDVYAVWLPRTAPAPFFTHHCTRWFRSERELFEHLGVGGQ
ncbi:MAG: hypothetical protein NTZ05_22530 [Chloroflexi bacterium]|nr:hypothetical protein [Chloroflexota bacterium]